MDNEQRLKALERRRRRGARLLAARVKPAEVARRMEVSRQSVSRWKKTIEGGGVEALQRPARFGRPPLLSDAQRTQLVRELKAGALAGGFPTELWTLPRIGELIERRFAVRLAQSSVWRLLRDLGWSVQRPSGQARERNERAIATWKARRWPEQKKSQRGKAE